MYPIYNHNSMNISVIYIYNKTSIKRNILTTKKKIHREVGRAKDLSAPLYYYDACRTCFLCVCVCNFAQTVFLHLSCVVVSC